MTVEQCWRVSETWYAGRLALGYERPGAAARQDALARAGLTGPAWELV